MRKKELEKIGIIDLGSNTARLVIVELLGDGHFIVVDQLKESVRLGKDMERDGFLKPQRITETLKTLRMFRKLCDAYGIEKIIAVATAFQRKGKEFDKNDFLYLCYVKLWRFLYPFRLLKTKGVNFLKRIINEKTR